MNLKTLAVAPADWAGSHLQPYNTSFALTEVN